MHEKVPPASGPVIHIHEDDWCMRRLFPASARSEVIDQLDKSYAASQKNKSGSGWNEIYLIEEPKVYYSEDRISVDSFIQALSQIAPRVRDFRATVGVCIDTEKFDALGSYETDALCFGFDAGSFVKAEIEGALIKQIWFDAWTEIPEYLDKLRAMILAVDKLSESYLADYHWNAGGLVRDTDFIDWYFDEHRAI